MSASPPPHEAEEGKGVTYGRADASSSGSPPSISIPASPGELTTSCVDRSRGCRQPCRRPPPSLPLFHWAAEA
ncbi:hypothetical protein C4D60_Mb06t02890 [Musa balbisiana]|uniref:Uncharacterized protein n=1 Tax=Musa balbisiana TaxID=52838 RepID=A0A4S8IK47_MUSBA|nr:hypothetical protein C4D60_Mb06t02890 [Musa balbisiana]